MGRYDFLRVRLGIGFCGIYFCDSEQIPVEVQKLFQDLDVGSETFKPIVISRRDNGVQAPADTFTAYGATDGTFYLVRPDRHVAARWQRVVPREARQAFLRALGN